MAESSVAAAPFGNSGTCPLGFSKYYVHKLGRLLVILDLISTSSGECSVSLLIAAIFTVTKSYEHR